MAIGNFTLTGQFFGLDGVTPAVGRVQIDGIPQVIIDSAGKKSRVGPRTVTLDTQGAFSISLPSNSTTGSSTTIGFRVTPTLKHQSLASVEFYAQPIGTTVDLAVITPQAVVPLTPTGVSSTDLNAVKVELDSITADPTNSVTSLWLPGKMFDAVVGAPTFAKDVNSRLGVWSHPGGTGTGGTGTQTLISVPIKVPSHWTTMTISIVWTNTVANAGVVSFNGQVHQWAIGESVNGTPAGGAAVPAANTTPWIATKTDLTPTVAATPAKTTTLRIGRNAASASDTLPNAIAIIGVILTKVT